MCHLYFQVRFYIKSYSFVCFKGCVALESFRSLALFDHVDIILVEVVVAIV